MSKFLTCAIMLGVLAASQAAAKPQTPANGARLCDIELEAVRQVLQTL